MAVCRYFLRSVFGVIYLPLMDRYRSQSEVLPADRPRGNLLFSRSFLPAEDVAVDASDILTAFAGTSASCGRTDPTVEPFREKGANTMADVHVYVNRPADKESA